MNNQAKHSTGSIANYSVNNQGGGGTSGNTNNNGNTQGIAGTGNQNNTTSADNLQRENDVLDEFERAQALSQYRGREVRRMEAVVENNKSLESAFQEQLNQPNLSQEDISKFQQQRQRMARLVATSTEQLNSMRREFAAIRQTVEGLYPQYFQIMMQD